MQFGRLQSAPRPLIRLSVAEVRHLFWHLVLGVQRPAQHLLAWSRWRREHQACAKFYHYQQRNAVPYLQL
jgi:hypothetical protein